MIRRPPRSTRTDTLFPYTTLFRSALSAIDLVTLNMDFDTGADHEQIVARLLPRIAAQAPHRPVAEHERVARWVLENLINVRSEEHTSELQSLMRISYAVFCLTKKNKQNIIQQKQEIHKRVKR